MYFSSLVMADEWDDFASSGKSFGGGNYVGEATNGDSSTPAEDTWNTNNGFGDGNDGGFNADGGYGDDEQRGDRGGHGSGRGRGRGRGGRGGGGGFGGRRDDGDRRERNYGDRDDDGDGNNRRGRGGGRGGRGGRGGGGGRGFDDNDDQNDGGNQVAEKPREFYIPPEPTEDDEEIFHSGISSGINFDKYDNIPVKISPGAPAPISTFAESGLRPFLLENIKKSGYSRPTPVQKYALPVILSGKDLMACAQTGSGKTAAYLLPMIEYFLEKKDNVSVGKPHGLIVSPTRELSIQIFSEARKFARGSILKISLVYGGTAVKHQGDNIAKGCHLLVCTPGRLLDFVEKGFITFEDLKFVVLDEADRMLDMGFLPNVETIMNAPHMRPMEERQTLMFSATFPEEIQRLAGKFLNDYVFLTIGIVGGACADVDQNFYKVTKFEKRGKLTEILENSEPGGTIVFVETKRNADFLASLLSETSFPTTSIHGDRLQRERELALSDFKSGKRSILIATSVAARGLDIKNVAHVINYDLPQKIDEYVHRIGRTGRVGNCGKATSFYNPDEDYALAPDLVKILKQANKPVPDFLLSVDGGGSSYGGGRNRGGGNRFGGRDVRDNTVDASDFSRGCAISEPQSQEPEELW